MLESRGAEADRGDAAERRDAAILALRDAALTAARSVHARFGRGRDEQAAEDLAEDLVAEQFARGFADLRRADGDASAVAWCRTLIERAEAGRHRREGRERRQSGEFDAAASADDGAVESGEGADPGPDHPRCVSDLDLSRLPPRQADALRAYGGAESLRAACRTLGVEWRTFRDLVERALRNLRREIEGGGSAAPAPARPAGPEDRSWAVELAWHYEEAGHATDGAVLRHWSLGLSAREIGRRLDPPASPESVRSRLQRIRRRRAARHPM